MNRVAYSRAKHKAKLHTMRIKDNLRYWYLSVASKSRVLSVLYNIFSREFDREQNAVMSGRAAYRQGLAKINATPALLRRNIHRIEKGLIMRPRRSIFAEAYILETVDVYRRSVSAGILSSEEKNGVRMF